MNMNTRHLLLTERDIRIKLVAREMHGYSKRTAFELSLHLASKQNNCLKKVSQFIFCTRNGICCGHSFPYIFSSFLFQGQSGP